VKCVLHVYISKVRIIIIIIVITNSFVHVKTLCFERLLFRPYSSSVATDMRSRHLDRLTLFEWLS